MSTSVFVASGEVAGADMRTAESSGVSGVDFKRQPGSGLS